MSSEKLTTVKDLEFARRFELVCGTNKPAEIERKYGISYHAARNYLEGRVPAAEKLKEIKSLTNVNLNWLLMGEGDMLAKPPEPPDLLGALDDRIRSIVQQVVREEIDLAAATPQDLGTVDEFLADSIRRHDDPSLVLQLWWAREGWPMDQLSVPDFSGWNKLTLKEKVKEIRSHRDILVRHIKRHEIRTPKET